MLYKVNVSVDAINDLGVDSLLSFLVGEQAA